MSQALRRRIANIETRHRGPSDRNVVFMPDDFWTSGPEPESEEAARQIADAARAQGVSGRFIVAPYPCQGATSEEQSDEWLSRHAPDVMHH